MPIETEGVRCARDRALVDDSLPVILAGGFEVADVEQAIDNIQAAMKRTEDYLREVQL